MEHRDAGFLPHFVAHLNFMEDFSAYGNTFGTSCMWSSIPWGNKIAGEARFYGIHASTIKTHAR